MKLYYSTTWLDVWVDEIILIFLVTAMPDCDSEEDSAAVETVEALRDSDFIDTSEDAVATDETFLTPVSGAT